MTKSCVAEERILAILARSGQSQYSKLIANAISEGGFLKALACKMPPPHEYSTPFDFKFDYLLSCYLSKFEGSENEDLDLKAISSFIETDEDVGKTNRFLRFGSVKNGVEGIISDARRKIIQILNPTGLSPDKFPFREFIVGCDWGPGATSSLKSQVSQMDNKILERRLSVTRRALKYAHAYFEYDTSWVSARMGTPCGALTLLPSEFLIVDADRFTTVPKNWKTRRSISIQPTLNLFFQKGVGRVIRDRLRRDGINLDDQSRNQLLAQRCYSDGYSTIDLAKASDTVSSELVRLLLPCEWFEVLDDLRTTYTQIGDKKVYLQKFSAMGNGYTFELESLIFYSLLWSVVRREADDWESEIAVYGDDLIVHNKHFDRVVEVLNYCGFTVNDDKSFKVGNFFESCGRHFFKGVDVTPVFQKKHIDTLQEAIRCSNRLLRWAKEDIFLDSRVRVAWDFSFSYANRFLLFDKRRKLRVIPRLPLYCEGDDGLLDPNYQVRSNHHGLCRTKVLVFRPRKKRADDYALLSYTLKKCVKTDSPFNGFLSLRGVGKYRYSSRLVVREQIDVLFWI